MQEDRSRGKLPAIEPYEAEAFPPRELMTGLDRLIIAGTLISFAGGVYMLARVAFG